MSHVPSRLDDSRQCKPHKPRLGRISPTSTVWALALCLGSTADVLAVERDGTDPLPRTGWKLLVDDHWIRRSTGLARRIEQPKKFAGNPILRGDAPWDLKPYCYGTAMYDPEKSTFKLWYMSYNSGLPVAQRTPVLYAMSDDGRTWRRPNLGVFEFQGSRDNNIVLQNYGHHDLYAPSVVHDPHDADPARRYKMLWWDFPLGKQGYQDDGMCVAFSPDGIHWTKHEGNPVLHAAQQARSISDVMSVMRDSRAGKFVVYAKGWAEPWPAFRQIVRSESEDFLTWSEPEVVLTHAHDERDPQSYGMWATEYDEMYLGLLASYKKPGNETIDLQLTVSHDNRHWDRAANQATFLPIGQSGAWDDGMLFPAPLLLVGDQVLLYYGGWDGPHNVGARDAGIGLATLPKDRFAALTADEAGGQATTHALRGAGGKVFVNAAARGGELRVEAIGADGRVLHGYSADDCVAVAEDGLCLQVSWADHAELPASGEAVQLRFVLKSAALYAFHAGDGVVLAAE